jgi:predicted ribosomally synthesized peptide with SipW-like signal peptide
MNFKKIIAGAAAVALTATVSIGATLAYLTDTDEDVNVMTLGDVYIDQIEQERVDDKAAQDELKDFEQNQPLLPAVYPGSSIPWAPENEWVVPGDEAWRVVKDNTNVIDKFVTVKNTGKSDAYVRTIFAFEKDGDLLHACYNDIKTPSDPTWDWDWTIGNITLDGVEYILAEVVYTGVLEPGKTTIPSLKQIYLDKKATNKDIENFGDTYDILVFSQAVQADGFDSIIEGPAAALDEAFGKITKENNPWINKQSSFAPASKGVIPALAEGGKVTLSSDVTVTDEAAASKNVITKDTVLNFGGNTVTLDIPGATSATANWVGVNVEGGNVVFDATTGGITTSPNSELFCAYVRDGSTLTINGGNYIGGGSCVQVRQGTLVVNGGYFEVNNPEKDYRYVLNCTDANYGNGTAQIIIKGGSFLNWNPGNNPAEGAGTSFLAPGYKVVTETVANGILYTVVAAE